jgi:protein SFI1
MMTNALNHWTNRVADIKFRELDTSTRFDNALVT